MVKGQFITVCGERFYEITNYDEMQPFFIALASDTDLWMYLSSTGGLTAGRRSPDEALFPYYTDDKITESHDFRALVDSLTRRIVDGLSEHLHVIVRIHLDDLRIAATDQQT